MRRLERGRCTHDDHVCSQVGEKRGLLLALLSKPSKSPFFRRTYQSECLMTIMSAQYSHRTGVQVYFVRDENKKEACFSTA